MALMTSIYLRVWSCVPTTVKSLADGTSRLNGEIAWVLHVLGYSDRWVDSRLDNHKAKQFRRHWSKVRTCQPEGDYDKTNLNH